ncbi:MAG: hypothetical protein QW379_00045 [Thermoplasmata archaeon]
MPRASSKATTIEIDQYHVVKAYCASRGMTVKEYVNHLIRDDIIRNADVQTSVMYFKGIRGE